MYNMPRQRLRHLHSQEPTSRPARRYSRMRLLVSGNFRSTAAVNLTNHSQSQTEERWLSGVHQESLAVKSICTAVSPLKTLGRNSDHVRRNRTAHG